MKINYRQLSIVVFMSFIALKLLSLPSFLYIESKNSAWLVALVLMLVDALYTFLLINLMKKCNCGNINEFMEKTLGKPLTKLILCLLLIKFALTVANISKGLEFFVIENFYNDFSWSLFVFPLVILCGFMIYKGIRNISRVFEMFVWAILIGCIYIAVKSITDDIQSPILCLVGPPGVGKTTFAESISNALNRKFVKISLGGMSDSAELVGHRRAYIGSNPGKIVSSLIASFKSSILIIPFSSTGK